MKHGRRFFGRLQLPSFASGSQKIGDFLGVALQVQQHEFLFASLKRTYLMFVILIISRGLIERLIYKITVFFRVFRVFRGYRAWIEFFSVLSGVFQGDKFRIKLKCLIITVVAITHKSYTL